MICSAHKIQLEKCEMCQNSEIKIELKIENETNINFLNFREIYFLSITFQVTFSQITFFW